MIHIVKNGNKLSVVKATIAEKVPDDSIAAYASASDFLKAVADQSEFEEEMPIAFGSAVKALDDTGRIGGYAILFSTKKDPDLLGDYFTKSTDFFFDGNEGEIPYVLYHHAQDPVLKATRLAVKAKATVDDVGVWVETQLDKRKKYEKAILKMVKNGELGFSTGSVSHLAARKAITKDIGEITAWPPIEVSLTPTPVEPRIVVTTLRAYMDELDAEDSRDNVLKTSLTSAQVKALPDDAFAYVVAGGSKDAEGRTSLQRLRYFPIKGLDGKYDEAHVRAALDIIDDAILPEDARVKAVRKIRSAARDLGIDLKTSKAVGERLAVYIEDHAEEKHVTPSSLIAAVAGKALSTIKAIQDVLSGEARPTGIQLKAFSKILGIEMEVLEELNAPPAHQITSVKGLFEDQLASEEWKEWELRCAFGKVLSRIANAAASAPLAGTTLDWKKLVHELVGSYVGKLEEVVTTQMEDYLDEPKEYGFYLRALINPSEEDFVMAKAIDIEDHKSLAVSALDSIDARVRQNHANRVKSGRAISAKNRTVFKQLLDDVQSKVDAGRKFLADTEPTSGESSDSAKALIERNRTRIRMLSIGT